MDETAQTPAARGHADFRGGERGPDGANARNGCERRPYALPRARNLL